MGLGICIAIFCSVPRSFVPLFNYFPSDRTSKGSMAQISNICKDYVKPTIKKII